MDNRRSVVPTNRNAHARGRTIRRLHAGPKLRLFWRPIHRATRGGKGTGWGVDVKEAGRWQGRSRPPATIPGLIGSIEERMTHFSAGPHQAHTTPGPLDLNQASRGLFCIDCAYPLSVGSEPQGTCPGCGRAFDLRDRRSARRFPGPAPDEKKRLVVVWIALTLLVAGIVAMQTANSRHASQPGPLPEPQEVASPFVKVLGKAAIGIKTMDTGGVMKDDQADELLKELDQAAMNPIDRLRSVGIAGWVGGPEVALKRLDAVDAELATNPTPDAGLQADAATMRAIFTSPDGAVEPAARDALIQRHDWFARVALAARAPATDADRVRLEDQGMFAVGFLVIAAGVIVLAFLTGVVMLIVFMVKLGDRRLKPQFPNDQAVFEPTRGSLLETITVFLAAFVMLQVTAAGIHVWLNFDATHILMWGLLPIVAWPTLRGITWAQTRKAIGWHTGRGVIREMAAGIGGYLAGLPIVLLSFFVSMLIISVLHQKPTHPVVDELGKSSIWTLISMYVLATLWAPIVEESMFRGAFYSHLRRVVNPVIAALAVGFVFAVIHPQGIGLVPPLMTLGAVFALIREWRGSLIGSMTAHALHNGFLITMMAVLFA